jgi:hypothetical protein
MHYDLLYPGDPLAERKTEILNWIEAVNEEKIPRDLPFEKVLKDGVILCNMMNKLLPGSVPNIHRTHAAALDDCSLTEVNYASVHAALRRCGVPDQDIFQTTDLLEARNIKRVVKCLTALARVMANRADYTGPVMDPLKMSGLHHLAAESSAACPGTSNIHIGKGTSQPVSGISMGKGQLIHD